MKPKTRIVHHGNTSHPIGEKCEFCEKIKTDSWTTGFIIFSILEMRFGDGTGNNPQIGLAHDEIMAEANKRTSQSNLESYDRGYKNGVKDEVECIETSGEHGEAVRKIKLDLLNWLLKNGSGGGNWRRLILQKIEEISCTKVPTME